MSPGRHVHRADLNQDEIVNVLVKLGCRVLKLTQVGQGCPDLLVKAAGNTLLLMEVKQPGGKLRPQQVIFANEWPVYVVHDVDEAVRAVNKAVRG
jgi:hypothetical protein